MTMDSHHLVLEFFLSSKQSICKSVEKQGNSDSFEYPGSHLPFLGKGIAVQFLEYPLLYLSTMKEHRNHPSKNEYPCGKRCSLDANLDDMRKLISEVMLELHKFL